ncbi:MAG TPA: phytoene desaturase [Flavobacteriia bacterium]|nr:phytoene desaturase [Flavobacteriia bacterium]
MKSISIIGSGFSSLSAACYLAKEGFKVSIFEKNDYLGGRARQFKKDGFTFDMGPTFYWMPDVFDDFFTDFNKKTSDYYHLEKLNPAYKVYFEDGNSISIGDSKEAILETFEKFEIGSAKKLEKFLKNAAENYNLAIKDLVYKPGENVFEIITPKTALKLNLFIKTIKTDINKVVKHPYLRKILEFPVLFLGAKPSNTPSFYNFMNYADFVLGTWYPKGGMYSVVQAMVTLAKSLGVTFHTNSTVSEIIVENNEVTGMMVNNKFTPSNIVLSGADYAHTEKLLPVSYRQYLDTYWQKKVFAPSALLFYVGFDKKLPNVAHHSLFFDADFELHAKEIYDSKKWPSNPLFYASFPSINDDMVAPKGKEAGVFLMPLATGLEDANEIREHYFTVLMNRLSKQIGFDVSKEVLFKESFCVSDFKKDYNSYGGNAYGLANTLLQTHYLRPKLRSKKVKNLFFTGQLTVPGPGVPPAIISGKIVSTLIQEKTK